MDTVCQGEIRIVVPAVPLGEGANGGGIIGQIQVLEGLGDSLGGE